jgi:O-antigen ligase
MTSFAALTGSSRVAVREGALALLSALALGIALATVPEWAFLPLVCAVVSLSVVAIGATRHLRLMRSLASHQGLFRYLATATMGAGVLAITFSGVRPLSGATLADILFVVAAGFLVSSPSLPCRVPLWLSVGAYGILVAGLLSATFAPPVAFDGDGLPVSSNFGGNILVAIRFAITVLVLPLLIGAVADSRARVDGLVGLWLASVVLNSLVALSDSFQLTSIGEQLTGLASVPGRAIGLTPHSNHLATIAAMAIPIALSRATTAQSSLMRRLSGVSVLVLAGGIGVSGSRAGLLAGALGVTLVLLFQRRERIRAIRIVVATLALTAVLVATAFGPGLVSELSSGYERLTGKIAPTSVQESDDARRQAYGRAIKDFVQHPLTGTGLGTARLAHNLYLQLLQGGGILLLCSFAVFALGALRLGYRLSRDSRLSADMQSLAGALTISLTVWLIAGLVQNPLYDRFLYLPVGFLLSLQFLIARAAVAPDEILRRGQTGHETAKAVGVAS